MQKLKSSTEMLKFCCITNLILFMINEGEKLIKGSVHEEDLFIVYNELVLITAKEKNECMRQKGNLHIWLLPLNGPQDRTPYVGRL